MPIPLTEENEVSPYWVQKMLESQQELHEIMNPESVQIINALIPLVMQLADYVFLGFVLYLVYRYALSR